MNDESMCQKCGTIHRESECPICRIAAKDKEIERLRAALEEIAEWVHGEYSDDWLAHDIAREALKEHSDES